MDDLRDASRSLTEPVAEIVEGAGLTPNMLSALSLCFSFLAFLFYYLSASDHRMLLVAAIMVMLNGLADAVDGALARRMGYADRRGDLLDHVIDRYSDVLLLSGVIFAGYVRWEIGLLAVAGVLMTSYIGTQAQALSLRRCYGGMLGRADRLVFLVIATIANALYPERIEGLHILGWMVLITMVLSHITAIQRFVHIWRSLGR
ncbi:MAG TPA: CDP-alcohol phosphatidyltransferase family protein [Methanothrix sp.]|nr:CDP-alcohol phosphatidyltransferase family protein [Methanothrix sp.]HOK57786.1 CDP-alcohol phosphatidyltransferase family protein [Methanothrix sp.]HOL43220.1 CDP-alcohol phosphatidyltransferase family protein [Methanothrix sp.]HPO88320.1 CDP-alcohol phosphatidyltransferase family protein [Methanothrix sp.]